MSDTYSVWTHNTSPEWLSENTGVSKMVLTGGMSRYNANFLVLRLKKLTPGGDFWVQDESGTPVGLVPEEDAYRELIENPRRVSVGLPPRP
jgi:hypothetical protein